MQWFNGHRLIYSSHTYWMLVLGTLRSVKQTQSLSSQSFSLCQVLPVIPRASSIYGQLQPPLDLCLLIYNACLTLALGYLWRISNLTCIKRRLDLGPPTCPNPPFLSVRCLWNGTVIHPNTRNIFDSFPLLIPSSYSQRKLCWLHLQKHILSPVASSSPPCSQHSPARSHYSPRCLRELFHCPVLFLFCCPTV